MSNKRIQRRLAAIIAADVVGYSKLMGQDEEGTLSRLKKLRSEFLHPKVSEYSGRIVKTTGDGTLIEFGSAVDAVSCPYSPYKNGKKCGRRSLWSTVDGKNPFCFHVDIPQSVVNRIKRKQS